jgi:hypothetical protein
MSEIQEDEFISSTLSSPEGFYFKLFYIVWIPEIIIYSVVDDMDFAFIYFVFMD